MALSTTLALVPWQASAQVALPTEMQLGLIGTASKNSAQIAEMHVTYRFDQMDSGKSAQAVPVQMTYRLHNPGNTQTLDVQMPTMGAEGEAPEITAIFVNGKEQPLPKTADKSYQGLDKAYRSISFSVAMPKDADVIVDIRALQPITGENIPFIFNSGRGWDGPIQSGIIEAMFPFNAANWNVTMRKLSPEPTLVPLAYSGRSANWTFSNFDVQAEDGIFWQIANLEAVTYYEQGLDLWRQNNNDPQAYNMLFRSLMDMTPCHGEQMPSAAWWNNTYDTISVGVISSSGSDSQQQSTKAMELYSANWTVPQGDNASCIEMQQRPDRYRVALKALLAIPQDQRSAAMQQTLEKHSAFLRKLVAVKGENSLQDNLASPANTDPLGDAKLSEKDRQLLAIWDDRFANPQAASQANQPGEAKATGGQSIKSGTSVSTTINNLLQKLPNLSFGTQIILFAILALIVLIIIGYIIFKWQEAPIIPERPIDFQTKTPPTVPLMGMGLGTKVNLAEPNPLKEEKIVDEFVPWQKPNQPTVKPWETPKTMSPIEPMPPAPPQQSKPVDNIVSKIETTSSVITNKPLVVDSTKPPEPKPPLTI